MLACELTLLQAYFKILCCVDFSEDKLQDFWDDIHKLQQP